MSRVTRGRGDRSNVPRVHDRSFVSFSGQRRILFYGAKTDPQVKGITFSFTYKRLAKSTPYLPIYNIGERNPDPERSTTEQYTSI